jgi:nitroreductase
MGPGDPCAVNSGVMPSPDQTLELLRTRRSVRQFTADPLTRDEVARLLEAARFAPSAHNYQTTRYVVVQDRALLAEITKTCVEYYRGLSKQLRNPLIRKAYRLVLTRREVDSAYHLRSDFDLLGDQYARGDDPILHGAPCLVVAYSEESINYPEANATLALHNMALMAHAMGLGSFLLGYVVGCCRRVGTIPAMLGIPEGHFVTSVLAVGRPSVRFLRWTPRHAPDVKWM